MANTSQLQPESQFPTTAIEQSVQELPKINEGIQSQSLIFTYQMASVADTITPWGPYTWVRDRQLREFWPTESNLAGAMANVCMRNAAFDFVIRHSSSKLETAVNDMLKSSLGPPGQIGWTSKETAVSQDFYVNDNGAFEELIRDPGLDANSKFKAEKAPVIGIAHLDSGQCQRTGDPQVPVIYADRHGVRHKMQWYQVIPFCEMPSPIARMNGVGISAVSRVLRAAQIMKSIHVLTDEMVSGRNVRKINVVGGVSRTDIDDARKRTQEQADNKGQARFIEHVILASLDPEKQVSVATINLAEFPTDFNYDIFMKWYVSTMALAFAVDYQEFAPLPGGNIGSSAQSQVLNSKANNKGPATYMKMKVEAYKTYGVLPRDCTMEYVGRNLAEELDKQTIRTKAMEEYALSLRNGVLDAPSSRDDLVRRGIYDKETIAKVPAGFGIDLSATTIREQALPSESGAQKPLPAVANPAKTTTGQVGGNTLAQDAKRTPTGKQNNTIGNRLQKAIKVLRGEDA